MILVEAATGRFPYPPAGEGGAAPQGGLGFWELLEYIGGWSFGCLCLVLGGLRLAVSSMRWLRHCLLFALTQLASTNSQPTNQPTPSVVEPAPRLPAGQFSPECLDFVHCCLCKDPAARPSAAALLNHPWLTRQPPADLGPLLARCARASGSSTGSSAGVGSSGAHAPGGLAGVGGSGSFSRGGASQLSRSGYGLQGGMVGVGLRGSGGLRASGGFRGSGGLSFGCGGLRASAAGGGVAAGTSGRTAQPAHPVSQQPQLALSTLGARGVEGCRGGGGGSGEVRASSPGLRPGPAARSPAGSSPGAGRGVAAPQPRSPQPPAGAAGGAAAGASAAPCGVSPRSAVSVSAAASCAARGVSANNRYSGLRGVPGRTLARRSSSGSSGGGGGSGNFSAAAAAAVAAMAAGRGGGEGSLLGRAQAARRGSPDS
jgi:hypothetical protein